MATSARKLPCEAIETISKSLPLSKGKVRWG